MINNIEQNALNLSKRELDGLFKLLTDNINIFVKVVPDMPLLQYIANGAPATDSDNPIIQAYNVWKHN